MWWETNWRFERCNVTTTDKLSVRLNNAYWQMIYVCMGDRHNVCSGYKQKVDELNCNEIECCYYWTKAKVSTGISNRRNREQYIHSVPVCMCVWVNCFFCLFKFGIFIEFAEKKDNKIENSRNRKRISTHRERVRKFVCHNNYGNHLVFDEKTVSTPNTKTRNQTK